MAKKKEPIKRELSSKELQKIFDQLCVRHMQLVVKSLEFEQKIRLQSIRLSRKYSKEQPWIV